MPRPAEAGLLAIAFVWLAFALLAVVPAPTYRAWQLAVLATEFGHLLAPIGLLFTPLWRSGGLVARGAAVAGWLGGALLLTPLVRALPLLAKTAAADPPGMAFDYRLVPGGTAAIAPIRMVYARRDSVALPLDLYVPATRPATPAPIVLVIHGGSWAGGDPTQLAPLNSVLAAHGYAVAAIGYRLAPAYPHPAQVDDVRAAIDWLRAHADSLDVAADRIVLLGRSAGGHLALLTAYTSRDPAIRGVVSLYAPTDLIWGWDNPASPRVIDTRGVLGRFIGGTPLERRAAFVAASPVSHAGGAPPTLLIHGLRDELVSIENQRRLLAALRSAGGDARALELPWATHGCDYGLRGPCGNVSTRAILQFLVRVAPAGRTSEAD